MKFYTFSFKGHYLDGCGVVQAATVEKAFDKAVVQIKKDYLWEDNQNKFTIDNLTEITDFSQAIILFDGNY